MTIPMDFVCINARGRAARLKHKSGAPDDDPAHGGRR
jgi:hypothetical protein